jgi:hypothetical protein
VQLDRNLFLNKHIENVQRKATSRPSLVKRLASTPWGTDKETLRSLFLGYVRSTLENNSAMQITCSKSVLQSLDRMQNNALRFISEGMRSTPSAAYEISTNVQPVLYGGRRQRWKPLRAAKEWIWITQIERWLTT